MIAGASYSSHILSFLAAGLFGSVIGIEREARDKGAGLRTHTLVSLGSCLFTVISVDSAANLMNGDPSRIAAQIVSGIGFLGGGAIIQEREKVHGLTTAATIWISAAIGMACGMREIIEGLIVTALTLIFLFAFRKFSRTLRRPRMTWLLSIKLKEEINDEELNLLETKLENSLHSQGFKLLELSEKTADKLEFVVRGQGKLSLLVKDIKTYLPKSLSIDLREF
jgi:uncharacterized membrane protein YhiD involved in acid resistance